MKYSIVPEIVNSKKIKLIDKSGVEVPICENSPFKYFSPFNPPFLTVDTFAKKTTQPEDLVNIGIDELRKLGFIITSIKAGRHGWFNRQQVIFRLEDISNPSPKSKRSKTIPVNHKIQRDKANNRIRLIGSNAGYPHRGNGGPWISILKE